MRRFVLVLAVISGGCTDATREPAAPLATGRDAAAPRSLKASRGPGEDVVLDSSNIVMRSPREQEVRMTHTGIEGEPSFMLGRVVSGGDGSPELRVLFADATRPERSVFELDANGIVASVKTTVGSHFEGFIAGHAEPLFRLNSYPAMQLELGAGEDTPPDVILRRSAQNTFSIVTGGTNGVERFQIAASGNVGIGTDSAVSILTIARNSATDPIADGWTTYSSRRWKTDVETITSASETLAALRGVRFRWRADGRRDIGLIAEEVARVLPEIVTFEPDGHAARAVDYSRLVALLIEGAKEQRATVERLERRVAELERRLDGPR